MLHYTETGSLRPAPPKRHDEINDEQSMEGSVSVVTILIIIVLVLLAIYLARRVL